MDKVNKNYRKGQTRVNFYLDNETYAKMMELCESHKVTKSDLLRKAVKHFITINATAEVRKQVKENLSFDIKQKLDINTLTAKKGD